MKTSLGRCVPGSKFCSPDREARTNWTPSWTAGTSTVSWMVACPWAYVESGRLWRSGLFHRERHSRCLGWYGGGGDFVLAGPMSWNWRAMFATAWSLHLLPETPVDPLPVKVKRRAGLFLVLQEVTGLRMTSCHQQANSVSWRTVEGRRPKPPRPEQMAAWITVNDEEASTENKETTTST